MTNNPKDKQAPHTGKLDNDSNKVGHQVATPLNQGRRTPESRNDRQADLGGGNQSQSRRGAAHPPKH